MIGTPIFSDSPRRDMVGCGGMWWDVVVYNGIWCTVYAKSCDDERR